MLLHDVELLGCNLCKTCDLHQVFFQEKGEACSYVDNNPPQCSASCSTTCWTALSASAGTRSLSCLSVPLNPHICHPSVAESCQWPASLLKTIHDVLLLHRSRFVAVKIRGAASDQEEATLWCTRLHCDPFSNQILSPDWPKPSLSNVRVWCQNVPFWPYRPQSLTLKMTTKTTSVLGCGAAPFVSVWSLCKRIRPGSKQIWTLLSWICLCSF